MPVEPGDTGNKPAQGAAVPATPGNGDWPQWRGEQRDGMVAWLPATLPEKKIVRWKQVLFSEGLGGVAVAGDRVVVGDRDPTDREDLFHGFDRASGERIWTLRYPAEGKLDYGNSPRATPLLHEGHAYLLGAFGHLHCVRLADGHEIWKRHLRDDFSANDELVWGACSSPLVVDGRLIVNPGAPDASLVALDLSPLACLTSIGDFFLSNCKALTTVRFSPQARITSVGEYFLSGCASLKALDLSPLAGLTSVSRFFLMGCAALKTVRFSPQARITSVGEGFLHNCAALTALVLSDSMLELASVPPELMQLHERTRVPRP
jgi:hypothetical protein